MTQVIARRTFSASAEQVFSIVTDVQNLPQTVPEVVSVEFLSEQRTGLGTRFRETRKMGKREMINLLEITEWVPNQRVRMVTDTHGTVWDTLFEITEVPNGTELALIMDARAHALLPKLMNPLMKGFFRKGMDKYLGQLDERFAATSGGVCRR